MRQLLAVLVLVLVPFLALAGEVKETDDLLKKNKVGLQKAADEAVKASPGTPVSARLVKNPEDGGPLWRVIVLKGERLTEVHVDGATGKAVVKSSWKDDDEAEKARAPRPGDGD